MPSFVLDASMTVAWHFRDEQTPAVRTVLEMTDDNVVVVPSHWFAEVANALLVGERRGRADPSETSLFVALVAAFDLEVDPLEPHQALARMLPLARAHGLTIYDTFYLELAERRGLPLASLDNRLCAAARSVGIKIVSDHL